MKIKQLIKFYLVDKNSYIKHDYDDYFFKNNHQKSIKMQKIIWIIKLNIKYRVQKQLPQNSPILETQNELVYPESLTFKREDLTTTFSKLMSYDVISFDIFDTLIFRAFKYPTDVFYLLGIQLGIVDFHSLRIQAETEARETTVKKNREINIYDIYNILETKCKLDKEKAIEEEIKIERNFLFANPFMLEIVKKLKNCGKKIVVVSDMYLPQEILSEILQNCGYPSFDGVYISNEFECGKWNGELQCLINTFFPPKTSFCHIGDNYNSDVLNSKKAGWSALYYKNITEIANPYRLDNLTCIAGSIYQGIVNAHIHNGNKLLSPYYEHGFIYGGILIAGYCKWLNHYAHANNIDQILFVARDGDIIYKAYNSFYKKVDNEYILLSRYAALKLIFSNNIEEFLKFHFDDRANNVFKREPMTIKAVLKEIELDYLIPYASKHEIDVNDILNTNTCPAVKKFIYHTKDIIVKHNENMKTAAYIYFKSIIGNHKNICVVDVGWNGSSISTLKQLLEKEFNLDIKVSGALVGTAINERINPLMAGGIIDSYIFSFQNNRELCYAQNNELGIIYGNLVEILFSAPQPSFMGFDLDLEGEVIYHFDYDEQENIPIINDIQKGMLDFISIFSKLTKPYEENIIITAIDAYYPLFSIMQNRKYNYDLFKNFKKKVYPGKSETAFNITVGQLMKLYGYISEEV